MTRIVWQQIYEDGDRPLTSYTTNDTKKCDLVLNIMQMTKIFFIASLHERNKFQKNCIQNYEIR